MHGNKKKREFTVSYRSHRTTRSSPDKQKYTPTSEEDFENLFSYSSNGGGYRRSYGRYHTNALKRFFRSKVGQNWNDVYSEFKLKFHQDDIDYSWMIKRGVKNKDGTVRDSAGYKIREGMCFIDENNIVRYAEKVPRKASSERVVATFVDGYMIFLNQGLYFKAPLDKATEQAPVYFARPYYFQDFIRGRIHTLTPYGVWFKDKGKPYKAIPRSYIRQLSSKELKTMPLPNAPIYFYEY